MKWCWCWLVSLSNVSVSELWLNSLSFIWISVSFHTAAARLPDTIKSLKSHSINEELHSFLRYCIKAATNSYFYSSVNCFGCKIPVNIENACYSLSQTKVMSSNIPFSTTIGINLKRFSLLSCDKEKHQMLTLEKEWKDISTKCWSTNDSRRLHLHLSDMQRMQCLLTVRGSRVKTLLMSPAV